MSFATIESLPVSIRASLMKLSSLGMLDGMIILPIIMIIVIPRPLDKFENIGSNMAAFVSHAFVFQAVLILTPSDFFSSSEPLMKGAVYLDQYLLDPESSFSADPAVTPFSRGCNRAITWFDYIEQPGNERLLRNMGAAMNVSASLFPRDSFVKGKRATLGIIKYRHLTMSYP